MKTILMVGAALVLLMPAVSRGQLAGGALLSKTAVSPIMDTAKAVRFTIGTTNADVQPIYVGGVQNIGWEMTGTATNGTSTVTLLLNFFDDATVTAGAGGSPTNWPPLSWWQIASNATATSQRTMTLVAAVWPGTTEATNFSTAGHQWMIPYTLANTGAMVSNLTVRYFLKPGM